MPTETALMVLPKPRTEGDWVNCGHYVIVPADPTPEYMTAHGHYSPEGRWVPAWYHKTDVDCYGGHLVAESMRAGDAQLLAAAPKLLDALEKIMQWAELLLLDHHPDFQEAKVALLMARGGYYQRHSSGDDAIERVRDLLEIYTDEQARRRAKRERAHLEENL